ncbi:MULTISPECIES: DUF739 family protein [Aerococcus]|uniref:DUF739 family protein n=2 Tax=Aerococcus TaxID=1375 RepID=A0A1E9PGT6_9LACT|nr:MULTISPECIES: DUF739 family protein [Aerococcus]MBU5611292.1 DUF739 family protein [Aerococcus urinae]MCY3034000.1 DUF739 family protein [Aerococcus mictus]MCY3065768.1 DUF739 family protein [Aerococcus mictus]MCY3066476.1 DUF739 family protein [Aerococcus mictus]MCY3071401.1 DUF739 family protein [Aerococcus mictus]
MFNYSKLSGKIVEIFGTQAKFAKAMKMSERSISLKLNNRVSWKDSEIIRACKLLRIPSKDIPVYFFKSKVQNI